MVVLSIPNKVIHRLHVWFLEPARAPGRWRGHHRRRQLLLHPREERIRQGGLLHAGELRPPPRRRGEPGRGQQKYLVNRTKIFELQEFARAGADITQTFTYYTTGDSGGKGKGVTVKD